MAKAFPLDLMAADGTVTPAIAQVSVSPLPGSLWRDYTVRVEWHGGFAVGTGIDAFHAFCLVREQLAASGWVPNCYGACRNFVVSAMASQMGGGLLGYLVEMGHPAGRGTGGGPQSAETFDAGPNTDLVSVAEQEAFKQAWFESLGLGGRAEPAAAPDRCT